MTVLLDELETITQGTSGTNPLSTDEDRSRFSMNVRRDLAAVIYQLNHVYKPLVETLVDDTDDDPLELGLAGNSLYTDVQAEDLGSDSMYWSSTLGRRRTIKESFDVVLAELARVESAQAPSTTNNDRVVLHAQDFSTSSYVTLTTNGLVVDAVDYANVQRVVHDSAVFVTAHWVLMDNSSGTTMAIGGQTSALLYRHGSAAAVVTDYMQSENTASGSSTNVVTISQGGITCTGRFLTAGDDADGAVYFQLSSDIASASAKAVAQVTWTEVANRAY